MKNILYIVFAIASIGCKAQMTLVPIQIDVLDDLKNGEYLTDFNGFLDPYVGTWVYTNGTTTLKFVLRKKINDSDGHTSQDIIYGEYQYIEDGIEKINTLSQIDNIYPYKNRHTIHGNYIISKRNRPFCFECGDTENRLMAQISDPIKDTAGDLFLRATTEGGQPALSIHIRYDGHKYTQATPTSDTEITFVGNTVPNGAYTLIKQP